MTETISYEHYQKSQTISSLLTVTVQSADLKVSVLMLKKRHTNAKDTIFLQYSNCFIYDKSSFHDNITLNYFSMALKPNHKIKTKDFDLIDHPRSLNSYSPNKNSKSYNLPSLVGFGIHKGS